MGPSARIDPTRGRTRRLPQPQVRGRTRLDGRARYRQVRSIGARACRSIHKFDEIAKQLTFIPPNG